ncbi:MAG: glycogen synthase [Tepidiformaceae bacterium]
MRILFASAEVDPYSKVGGLGDVAASLPRKLREMGHDIRVITPGHASALAALPADTPSAPLAVSMPGGQARTAAIRSTIGPGAVPILVVDDPHYFARDAVYGEPDDLLRYQFFCRAVIQVIEDDPWKPDILHLNDWHTAPLAFALRSLSWGNPVLRGIATVFTIHNLRYRGPDPFNDFLAQGIYYSDAITTVSPTYAREILTREYGEGLDPLLNLRSSNLTGILNGIDYDTYNPRNDAALTRTYDLASIAARAENRAAVRSEVGLPAGDVPLIGAVARLTEQKGIDLIIRAVPAILQAGAQLLVLGEGDRDLVDELTALSAANPGSISFVGRFDEDLARRVYAGSDIFLMPSRYEPCGLGQLLAMRYGAVPVGRRTGGLADTIADIDEHPDSGTGFLFDDYSTFAFEAALGRAVRAYTDERSWARIQANGMNRDHSWRASAVHYVEAYGGALRARGILPLE